MSWQCEKCIYYPPSSFGGKPCGFCEPDSQYFNCFQPTEEAQSNDKNYRFTDMSGSRVDCGECRHNDKHCSEMPCDACCLAHCGFERKDE